MIIARLPMWCSHCARKTRHVILGYYWSRCQSCGTDRTNPDYVIRAYEASKGK